MIYAHYGICVAASLTLGLGTALRAEAQTMIYPPTATGTASDNVAGEKVADPYRWLEEDVRQNKDVAAWVASQNQVTQNYLANLPGRSAILTRLRALMDYERTGLPTEEGGRLFFVRNSGLQNQSPLYVRDKNGTERVLIDPNGWSKDSATALADWAPSHDGKKLAYLVQEGGSDWMRIRALDVDSGTVLSDDVRWAKFTSINWSPDNKGFYYSRMPEPKAGEEFTATSLNQAVYYHKLGTAQAQDKLIYATPDHPSYNHGAGITEDGRWMIVITSEGTDDRYIVHVRDLKDAKGGFMPLVPEMKNNWTPITSQGDWIYFLTNLEAPMNRIVRVNPKLGLTSLQEIVPQKAMLLSGASRAGGRMMVEYLQDVASRLYSYALDGSDPQNIALPGLGSTAGISSKGKSNIVYYNYSSFNRPSTIYRLNVESGETSIFSAPKLGFNPDDYDVRQVFYTSKDGARVPMFLVRRKGTELRGPAPTLLYGYGGFNISLTPAFSVANLVWMEMGGVYAMANLRGGGEYGKDWHDGGRLAQKQNVFNDFIAAGEYLVQNRITTPQQLAIEGRSNGGLLVGAVVNQRPDLFAAALPAVGVMDMLRFHRFTAGRYWVDDYGNPEDAKDFAILKTYSPYHNIPAKGQYPAILVTTADTDDRVVPGHSFKYTARLQANDLGPKPHLIRIETRAGHGAGKPTDKLLEERADLWAFAGWWTGLTRPSAQPPQ